MTHASLCSGIGASELAAAWMGWENAFQCENDPFCRRVLEYWFNKSEIYGDIRETDFSEWRGRIDVLTAGFPCQPFSVAGQRKGADDDRYLWPEIIRVIGEVQPCWFIGENVAGITSMVQPGSEVEVESEKTLFEADYTETVLEQEYILETVCNDLERAGYTVQPVIIPACAVGAPHRRDRIFIIAHRTYAGTESMRERQNDIHEHLAASDTAVKGLQREMPRQAEMLTECFPSNAISRGCRQNDQSEPSGKPEQNIPDWRGFPAQSPVCRRDDGISGRLAGITFPQWRNGSIKAFGNAIVPQVMYEIFKTIDMINNNLNK
ncbi:MAG: DNA cytosine methyltransferase [Prevotellaceae bacterium]|jgi:DNA (cytosine-5)-methyltransferase 1|nr:DNA cytosine methyltransferase [Prevotellaceae bacterium]